MPCIVVYGLVFLQFLTSTFVQLVQNNRIKRWKKEKSKTEIRNITFLPVKAAIAVGKYHEVRLKMIMTASAATSAVVKWFGQKTDERTSNRNKIAKKTAQSQTSSISLREPRNRSKQLKIGSGRGNLFDDEGCWWLTWGAGSKTDDGWLDLLPKKKTKQLKRSNNSADGQKQLNGPKMEWQ